MAKVCSVRLGGGVQRHCVAFGHPTRRSYKKGAKENG
jgi:hypothetical protein